MTRFPRLFCFCSRGVLVAAFCAWRAALCAVCEAKAFALDFGAVSSVYVPFLPNVGVLVVSVSVPYDEKWRPCRRIAADGTSVAGEAGQLRRAEPISGAVSRSFPAGCHGRTSS